MDIIKTVHKALSDKDIRQILGDKCKIIKYSALSQYNTLFELLPELIDYVVILYEDHLNSGHWVGLLKYNNMFEFFDAYGLMPDKELLWVDLKIRQSLNERIPYLTNLLKMSAICIIMLNTNLRILMSIHVARTWLIESIG